MIFAALIGLIVGILMCVPIGPLNIWVINTQIKKSEKEAMAIAAGGSFMDFCYFILILSGLSIFHFNDTAKTIFNILGIIFIFLLGAKEMFFQKKVDVLEAKSSESSKISTKKGIIAAFILGVVIYTSNPTLLITMTALGTFIKGLELFETNTLNIFILSLFLGLGSFIWFLFLIKFVQRYKETIREKYLSRFAQICGVLMIILGILLSYRFYTKG